MYILHFSGSSGDSIVGETCESWTGPRRNQDDFPSFLKEDSNVGARSEAETVVIPDSPPVSICTLQLYIHVATCTSFCVLIG